MTNEIRINRGQVVGIGRVKIPKTKDFNHEIQLLSFIDIKESETSYIATCIHLRIDGYGKTIEEAEEDMVENVYYFLRTNFSKLPIEEAWNNLRDLYKSDEWSNELWEAYHEVQIRLSMQGKPTDNYISLLYRLDQLSERVKEWEKRLQGELEKTRIELDGEIKKLAKNLIVESTRLDKVA